MCQISGAPFLDSCVCVFAGATLFHWLVKFEGNSTRETRKQHLGINGDWKSIAELQRMH